MQVRPEIFAISVILFVPLAYATFSIQDACAVPASTGYLFSKNCSGDERDPDKGQLCCWNEKDSKGKEQLYCQICREAKGGLDCDPAVVMSPPPPKPELSGTLEEGNVLEGNATGRLPGGGIFKVPETNLTFSQTDNSSNTSDTLAKLQSDAQNDNEEDNRNDADESGESGDSNEEEEDE